MSAALSHRGALVVWAAAAYAAVGMGLVFAEVPGLGLGHFLYLPIAAGLTLVFKPDLSVTPLQLAGAALVLVGVVVISTK